MKLSKGLKNIRKTSGISSFKSDNYFYRYLKAWKESLKQDDGLEGCLCYGKTKQNKQRTNMEQKEQGCQLWQMSESRCISKQSRPTFYSSMPYCCKLSTEISKKWVLLRRILTLGDLVLQ